jgi:hypothetical protein
LFTCNDKKLIVVTYVDDLLVISDNIANIQWLYQSLGSTIIVNSLGPVNTFLGIEITRDRTKRTITLSQKKYTQKLLQKFGYTPSETMKPLIPIGNQIAPNTGELNPEATRQYQQEIGSIMYLMTKTRPDLAYPIGLCARFMANPGPEHFKALNKIWKYLCSTWDLSLHYQSESQLFTYCDADWGGDTTTRRSTTGFACLYRGGAITWNSRLQKTVALSSCEAEYMSLKEAVKEQVFIKSLLSELGSIIEEEILANTVYTDSQSAIELAKNPLYHHRTKHIDIQYHFVREKFQEGISQLTYIPTDQQIADGLTKSIDQQKWLRFIQGLGLQPAKESKPTPLN